MALKKKVDEEIEAITPQEAAVLKEELDDEDDLAQREFDEAVEARATQLALGYKAEFQNKINARLRVPPSDIKTGVPIVKKSIDGKTLLWAVCISVSLSMLFFVIIVVISSSIGGK